MFGEGDRVVEAAREGTPDLVVVDLHLKGLHGIEVAQSIGPERTSILVDEAEPGIDDLQRMGLEVMVRPKGGAEGLADGIEARLQGVRRLVRAVEAHEAEAPEGRRAALLSAVGGDEENLLRAVLEDEATNLLAAGYLRRRRLEEEWLRSRTTGLGLSAAVIAVNDANAIAERHGDDALREVEQRIAGIMMTELDGTDLPAKDGPGRFLVLMPATTVGQAGERLFGMSEEVSDMVIDGADGPFRVSVSVGLASAPHDYVGSAEELIGRAEEAAGSASRAGAAKVCFWQGVRELRREDCAR